MVSAKIAFKTVYHALQHILVINAKPIIRLSVIWHNAHITNAQVDNISKTKLDNALAVSILALHAAALVLAILV